MNLILVENTDFISCNTVKISGRRFQHIQKIIKPTDGQILKIGLLGGSQGTGTIVKVDPSAYTLEVVLTEAPPSAIPLTLILALPRPKVLLRTIANVTSLGIKNIYLLNAYRVEKSYWHCDQIKYESLQHAMRLGLEQACDTILPTLHIRRLFKPFAEDELPEICRNTTALLAHPHNSTKCPSAPNRPITLAIGPEGGFIEFEVSKLTGAGMTPIEIGSRILKVETAIAALIGKLAL